MGPVFYLYGAFLLFGFNVISPCPDGFETIGCFKDTSNRAIQPLEGKDSILDGSYGARKNAIAKCAVAAMRKGYKMFAVQHGGWCAASATADQTFDKYGRSAACGSDGEGGPWANQVYVIKGFETIGCFKDTSNRAIQPLEGKDSILDGSYGARKNAIAKCAVAAMRKGYKMFAVQHGGWCAASATADQTFDKYGRSAACGSDGEGGPWANQVYVIKGFETIGCFKDTSNRAIQPLEGKDSILDGSYGARKNAIAKCAVAAMRKGYKMFAVQHGGWCAASATADQTFDKYGRSAACGSDGEGGPWANQVYVIKGFETIGCFKDTSNRAIQPLEGKDSILDGSYGARKNAIAKCAVAAMRKGYKMFAVQHGGWCAASATADQTFDKYGRSAACGSDGEGGPWANQVYVIKGFETIGCFKDTSNRAIQPLEGKDSILDGSYGARKNAIAKCAVAAMRKGYKMFAVQHGGWCAASATADQTFDKYGGSAACGSDGEGGPWANQVYVIKEIDECSTGKHNCSHVAVCNNSIGSYNCICKEGYVGDGRNCSDIDECSTGEHNCTNVAVCKNTIGSYHCACQEGYVGDGRSCSDIDECSTGKHNCSHVAVCNNTIGSYNCTCKEEYVGDGRNCSEIDECSTGKHNCSHVAVCNNSIGSYNCICKEGYVGDGRNCSDIDECSTGEHNCTNVAVCKNTIGSYHCACQEGYVGDGRSCSDIDECSTGKHNCSHVAVCNNTIGSYNCTCKEEYVGDGRNCSACWCCSQISMSVQQENITAAMWPCATTPLVHITALVRKNMLETDETAQISMSVQQENITAAMWPCATTPLVHITALVRKNMLETDETAQRSMSVQRENITAAMWPCATTLLVHITAFVRRDMLEMDETVQISMSVQQENTTAPMWPCAKTPLAHITAHVKKDMLETDEAAQISMSVQQENITAAMWPCATTPLVHITALVRKNMLETDETAQRSMSVQRENITAAMWPCATTLLVHITAFVRRDMLEMDETVQISMSVQQENTTAPMWPCAKTPLAHITAHVKKDMLETDEAAQISMSVQQENITAAMWPCATTPLVHIAALVRKNMLETDETAQIVLKTGWQMTNIAIYCLRINPKNWKMLEKHARKY
ncbi:uncharacterized protein [Montipora foliosa]|uniref:uncharacterized protein isoform X9 n=1 Tax=Montipora foliosa TaxID=591990 RepID=UPI0035F181F3